MKLLVTGGLGFIGSHLAESLFNEKHEIIILTKSLSKKKNLPFSNKKIKIVKTNVQNFTNFTNFI